MDYSKSMGTPSTNQPSAPPSYQASSLHPPPYSALPQGYGFSQQYVTYIDQQPNQHHSQQPFSIGQQHPNVESAMQGSPVNDYFGYSIFTMICCCLPLGLVALISSLATRDAIARGDRQMAEMSSRRALMLNHAALGSGIGIFCVSVAMVIFLFVVY